MMKTTDFPAAINVPRQAKMRGGPFDRDFDFSHIQVETIIMASVWYHSPYRIHGVWCLTKGPVLLPDKSPDTFTEAKHYFVGYRCTECNEVFLVPDTVKGLGEVHEAMRHKCMEAE